MEGLLLRVPLHPGLCPTSLRTSPSHSPCGPLPPPWPLKPAPFLPYTGSFHQSPSNLQIQGVSDFNSFPLHLSAVPPEVGFSPREVR